MNQTRHPHLTPLVEEQLQEYSELVLETNFKAFYNLCSDDKEDDDNLSKDKFVDLVKQAATAPEEEFKDINRDNFDKYSSSVSYYLRFVNSVCSNSEVAKERVSEYPFNMVVDGKLMEKAKPEEVEEALGEVQDTIRGSFLDKIKQESKDKDSFADRIAPSSSGKESIGRS